VNRVALVAGAAELDDVLTAQHEVYRALVSLAREEQSAIIDADVERLTALVDRKETLLDQLRAMETERMTALVAIEAATGLPVDTTTLAEIAAQLPSAPASALDRTARGLRAEALELQEVHATNEQLLLGSRSLIDRWVNYLRSVLAGSLYDHTGGSPITAGGRTLDRSA
jgi:flagellar biosynthesis/type III secretory pathway chaperone